MVNEIVVLICVWLMFHSSSFVESPETRYELAYYFLYLVATDVAINVLFLVYSIVKKIFSGCRRAFVKRRAKNQMQLKVQQKVLNQGIQI